VRYPQAISTGPSRSYDGGMSAQEVGRHMPAMITLDDLAAMIDADEHGHRYETSPEGALSVVPPPDHGHAVLATRLMAWFIAGGLPLEQIVQVVGIRIPGPVMDGGRIPDLLVWSKPQPPSTVWNPTDDLLLTIEIVSPGSAAIDQLIKVAEYAKAGIPRYWTVARDPANTVTQFRLATDSTYRTVAQIPLAELLKQSADDYLA
jgi:Uma2 family endonuclease